jgi:hypothetical protein
MITFCLLFLLFLHHCLIKNIWLWYGLHKGIFAKQLTVCSKYGTFCNIATANYCTWPLPNYFLYDF